MVESTRKGECVRCGECCTNPTISVNLPEDLAAFYSYFGIEVAKINDKFKGKFRVGTVCRHYSVGSCDIYEQRPQICKDYPGENVGLYKSCGYK